jgi:hypothetical protein
VQALRQTSVPAAATVTIGQAAVAGAGGVKGKDVLFHDDDGNGAGPCGVGSSDRKLVANHDDAFASTPSPASIGLI